MTGQGHGDAGRPRGNVLFITVDQWRGDCLSIGGHPVVQTPAMDRLARAGVRFSRHHANAAPCGPSRACLYTGTYLMTNRAVLNGTPLDGRFTNVAREAAALGFDPKLFGYTDISVDPRGLDPDDPRLFTYEEVLPGFDPVVDLREDLVPWAAWLRDLGYDVPDDVRAIYDPQPDVPGASERGSTWAPPVYPAEHSEAAFLTGELISWLTAHTAAQPDTPWFVHASYIRPHPPYIAPAPYHDMYDPATVPMPVRRPDRADEQALHVLNQHAMGIDLIAAPEDEAEMRQLRATYYGMMSEVDAQLGRLFDWLDASGEAERTLVVLTSDHGDQLGDHWLLEKLGYWDESYHVPLIIRDPFLDDAARGRVVDRFTEHVDVLPTILDWLGAEVPLQCDGRSLAPFLGTGEPDAWRAELHWQWDFRTPTHHLIEDIFEITMEQCSLDVIRDDDVKYVHFGAFPPLLFDLRQDPDQFVNVADDPAYASVRAEYAEKLLAWRMRHDERTLTGHFVGPRGLSVRRDPRV